MNVAPVGSDVSYDPRDGSARGEIRHTSAEDISVALSRAEATAHKVASHAPQTRAGWLEAVASALEDNTEALVALADDETGLGLERLRGEVAKTAAQARFYASVALEGSHLDASIDHLPDGSDLRRVRMPVGPVAVFAASNFPFAFGTLGHDTTSALAAGCPVLVKGHPAHPRLSAALADLAEQALTEAGAPGGTFAVVTGMDAGLALVDAPGVSAVAFTGSQRGGMALAERARRRPRPIPVFAEMGTVNPAIVTPAGAEHRLAEIVSGFVGSLTLGHGQFCTKPGLLLVPTEQMTVVIARVREALADSAPGRMLTAAMATGYADRIGTLRSAGADVAAQGPNATAGFATAATVMRARAEQLHPDSPLLEECFGPLALVVDYASLDEAVTVLARLQPSLAASVLTSGTDDPDTARLVHVLTAQVGRVVVDGWPTGVATTWSQQHGGPWPATSRPEATSVGAGSLDRFTRPIAFQGVPQEALPHSLRDDNPWGLPRRIDGSRVDPTDRDASWGATT